MDLLIDTQALVWTVSGDPRLSPAAREALAAPENRFFVSAVTAFEFIDLEARGRFPPEAHFGEACEGLGAELLDYPAAAWRLVPGLPDIHRDPIDRMLIAHAIHADMTLLTADATMRRYPVRTIW